MCVCVCVCVCGKKHRLGIYVVTKTKILCNVSLGILNLFIPYTKIGLGTCKSFYVFLNPMHI